MILFSSARFAAYFCTVFMRRSFLMMVDFLAIGSDSSPLRPQREVERLEQRAALLIRPRSRRDRDIHAPHRVDLVVVDLGEDDLLADADVVVALAVERARRKSAEVADARDRDVDQPIEELVHPLATQRDLAADRETLANLEARDRAAGPR